MSKSLGFWVKFTKVSAATNSKSASVRYADFTDWICGAFGFEADFFAIRGEAGLLGVEFSPSPSLALDLGIFSPHP